MITIMRLIMKLSKHDNDISNNTDINKDNNQNNSSSGVVGVALILHNKHFMEDLWVFLF